MDLAIKKTIFSGAQPSGMLSIGNYLGALKNWQLLQEDYRCLYCVVDLHALTVRQNPAELRKRTLETLAIYMACGIDPEKGILFVQSHVAAHAELAWILGCHTMFGELSRMTQFKEKSKSYAENINAGLFTYPVLMAADILLYQADLVPVGVDQTQHIELARNIAERFNSAYSPTFTVPQGYSPKTGAKIMSLADPQKKMSKSDPNPSASVNLLDTKDDVIRKFKRAVTDSLSDIRYDPERPGIANLMSIYSCFTGKNYGEIEKEFEGKGYGDFKLAVGEACNAGLAPIQARFTEYMNRKDYLESVMRDGAERAAEIAHKTLRKIRQKVGLLPKIQK